MNDVRRLVLVVLACALAMFVWSSPAEGRQEQARATGRSYCGM